MPLLVVLLTLLTASGIGGMPESPRRQLRLRSQTRSPLLFCGGVAHCQKPRQQLTAAATPSPVSVPTARLLLVVAAAIYGTYSVLLRGLTVVGGEPLPSVFVAFVRYQFLTCFAAMLRGYRTLQTRRKLPVNASSKSTGANTAATADDRRLWLAATELAAYTVATSLLSIFGLARVPAFTSEILSSTLHLFVPLLTLLLVGRADFGARTWAGCALAFAAALLTTLYEGGGGGGGGGSLIGQASLIASAFFFGIFKVRTQVHLRTHSPERLNTARMVAMGALSFVPLLVDLGLGGDSRRTLTRLHKVLPAQWCLMALSVFLSAFVASSLQFAACEVIPAANAQPFSALQPPFAALWSLLLLAEPISMGSIFGGALMLIATVLACTDTAVGAKQGNK